MAIFLDTQPANIATKVFKTDTPLLSAIPRMKFSFYAEFITSNEAAMMMSNANLNTWQSERGISFKVKTIDKPKITLETKELNQYNKKRLIYTNISYGDASIRLHDSVDDSVLAFWVDYFTFYFADSRSTIGDGGDLSTSSKSAAFLQPIVESQFIDDTGWGFRPLSEQTQFFLGIRIWALYNQTFTRFSYINPKITSIDWQNHDYTSGGDTEEVTINFKYEAIQYESFGQQLTSDQLTQIGQDPLISSPQYTIPRQQARLFSNSQTSQFANLADGTTTRPPLSYYSGDPASSTSIANTQTNTADPSNPIALPNSSITTDTNNLNTGTGAASSSLSASIGQTPMFG